MELKSLRFDLVPKSLSDLRQWILWKTAQRGPNDKPTKLPYQVNGDMAKSNDQATWVDFSEIEAAFSDCWAGIGFVFSPDDPFVGVDLDGCRSPETGKVADWAREIILKFDSYAEVSPSQTGVKIFCRGRLPFANGKKVAVPGAPKVCEKEPAIEVYDRGRYFAVTGWRVKGPVEPMERQDALAWLKTKYWQDDPAPAAAPHDFHSQAAIIERARKYLAKLPGAMSGQNGHGATFHAACVLVLGFELHEADARALMDEYNLRCMPAWSAKELDHKVRQAAKQPGQRGYLKNASPASWQRIQVPQYDQPDEKPGPRVTTLVSAARRYVDSIGEGKAKLITLGVPELDYALAGGVQPGEYVVFAARPSHGKSAAALQCIHHWTADGIPCAIVSEEMSAMMLGRRTLQFLSPRHEEHWNEQLTELRSDIDTYAQNRKDCIVIESCGTAEAACKAIERAVRDHGIQAAAVDYLQLLRAPGKNRYEQVTEASRMLRDLTNRTGIVLLVLCQLSRGVEQRQGGFSPVMSDIKESGQIEQDADVITMLCWPHRLNKDEPLNKYQFWNLKNRHRGVRETLVECRFIPDRQMILDSKLEPMSRFELEQEEKRTFRQFN